MTILCLELSLKASEHGWSGGATANYTLSIYKVLSFPPPYPRKDRVRIVVKVRSVRRDLDLWLLLISPHPYFALLMGIDPIHLSASHWCWSSIRTDLRMEIRCYSSYHNFPSQCNPSLPYPSTCIYSLINIHI